MYRRDVFVSVSAGSLGFVLFSGDANAYLDPGTGSILLQGLIAAIVGVSVTARLYWSRIKGMLGMSKKESEDNTEVTVNERERD